MSKSQQEIELIRKWSFYPETFIDDNVDIVLTGQQRNFFIELGKMVRAKCRLHHKQPFKSEEEEIYAKKTGISIMSGKGCHAKGTEFLLPNGVIELVENITVGDKLIGDDGRLRKVLALSRGIEQMYRVEYPWGEYYDVNENHILSLVATGSKGKRKTGDKVEVTLKDYLTWGKDKKRCHAAYKTGVPSFVNNHNLTIDPYILGIWLGDGDSRGTRFYNIDKEVINEIKKYGVSKGLKYKVRIVKEHTLSSGPGKIGRNTFLNDLHDNDLIKNKHIPFAYKTASRQTRLSLLAGLLDSDGHLDKRNRRVYTIIQKRKHLSRDIVFIARSLGFHATLTNKIKSWTWKGKKKSNIYYEVSISRGALNEIPCKIPRKQALPPSVKAKKLHFMFTVSKLKKDNFYGFTLDGNGRFLGSDFTVLHNTGKDTTAALCVLWFLTCFPLPKVPCTAPSGHQLKDILWSEISHWWKKSKLYDPDPHKNIFELQTDKFFLKELEGKEHFAVARTASVKSSVDEQAKTLDGFHADYMMIIVDEADGVPDPVFTSFETTLSSPVNFVIMIFNPTKSKCYAVQSHLDPKIRKEWVCLHWDAEESENVSKVQIERLAKYGLDSNIYRIYVKGLPPHADPDTLIPWDWVMNAVDRDIVPMDNDPIIMGIDPARFGNDSSVILTRRGGKVDPLEIYNKIDTFQLSGWALGIINEKEPLKACIDTIGIGAGVADNLRHNKISMTDIIDVSVSETPSDIKKFNKLRDELWWKCREKFEKGIISIPNDEELIGELSSIRYEMPNGKIKVEGKKELKKRGLPSPNRADALCLTLIVEDEMARKISSCGASKLEEALTSVGGGSSGTDGEVSGKWMG